jgi:glycosyltransferase involved in cell wall biosynthesis
VVSTSGPLNKSVSIVIPAYNEGKAIGPALEAMVAAGDARIKEIIVVDDGSKDDTGAIAAGVEGVTVIRHPTNRGYGAALKTGIRAATGDYVLSMDADGQHRPDDVLKVVELALAGNAPECVIGQRTALVHSPLWRMPGKWFLTLLAQFLTQRKIPDLNSGLRAIRRDVALRYLRLCPQGFSFSTTITMALLSRGYGVSFVPITVAKRIGRSTVSAQAGFQTILLVIRLATLFNPLRIFLPGSFLAFTAGIAWGVPYVLQGQGITVGAMLAVLTGVLLFALGLICDQVAQLRLERFE